jgi:hypothetical protein
MTRQLKVYGWTGYRIEARQPGNTHGQTREIVAAHSIAEVSRLTGLTRYYLSGYCSDTRNARELEVALAAPGVVFWRPLDGRGDFKAG